MKMTSPNLNTIPADIAFLLTQYIDQAALRKLALVDKPCHTAFRTALFRYISIKVSDLSTDIDHWHSILQRSEALRAVRHLRVEGSSEEPPDFTPLVDFMPQLAGLTQLSWSCTQQFSVPLLRILENRLPSCKLYLDPFRLFSIFDPSQERYERALVSSPNLHAICVGSEETRERLAQQGKILKHIISSAPDLRCLDRASKGAGFIISPDPRSLLPEDHPWLSPPAKKGRLETFHYMSRMNRTILSEWNKVIDWSKLRSLTFKSIWDNRPDPQVFDYLSTTCRFDNLEALDLRVPQTSFDEDETAIALAATSFLCHLRPLSKLRLSGDMDHNLLRPVLEIHGKRLRSLKLSPLVGGSIDNNVYLNHVSSNAQVLFELLSHCRHLEDLDLPIPRTRGNAEEVALYRAIGRALPRLQEIDIILDATDPDYYGGDRDDFDEEDIPTHPDFDDFDNEFLDDWAPEQGLGPRKGSIRHAFINSAVDEKLVKSIFWTIDSETPEGSLPLEEVRFKTKPGGWTGDGVTSPGIGAVCAIMGQSWIVRRSCRDDQRSEIHAASQPRLSRSKDENDVVEEWDTIKAIFRRLWPSSRTGYEGPEGWREDWHSLPLAV